MLPTGIQLSINRLKVKGRKKIYHINTNQNIARMAISISDKVDFRAKNIHITRNINYQKCYFMIKKTIHQEKIIAQDIYASDDGASKYVMKNW